MNIKEYIQHRYNLENTNRNELSKEDYNYEKDNYKKLLKISHNHPFKLNINFGDYLLGFYIFIGFLLSLIFSMGYANILEKEINIAIYILFVVAIPFILMVIGFSFLVKRKESNCFERMFNLYFNFFFKEKIIIKEILKKTFCFYSQIISISYSIFSILWLGYYTAIKSYSFSWESTWLPIKIVKFFSIPIDVINHNWIPIELATNLEKFSSSDNIWLSFLLLSTIVWIIIPKIVILLINKYKLKRLLLSSFINNEKSKRILDYISPITSTTNSIIELKDANTRIFPLNKTIKFDLSDNTNYKTFVLWQLTKIANEEIKENNLYKDANKIYLDKALELNHEDINSTYPILILINSENTPKRNFVNLLNKLNNQDITIKSANKYGTLIKSSEHIEEWIRFLRNEYIQVEVINE